VGRRFSSGIQNIGRGSNQENLFTQFLKSG
jgi:hypothetical protein